MNLPEIAAELAHKVCDARAVGLDEVMGRKRHKSVSAVRGEVAAAWRDAGYSVSSIARWLGRDRSTVLYLMKAHAWREANRAAALAVLPEVWTEVPFKAWNQKGEKSL